MMSNMQELREYYGLEISEYFEGDERQRVTEYIESLFFKFSKNQYHYGHLQQTVEKHDENEDVPFYDAFHLPIYYETESLLVNMRSTVDVALHLVNVCFHLDIKRNDVTTHSVYFHPKLPSEIKGIMDQYTRPYDNPVWKFIYTSRNEIVHEKSVEFVLPLQFDTMEIRGQDKLFVTFEKDGQSKDVLLFFKQCIQFLESLVIAFLQSAVSSLKRQI